jgi:hypothetical protein
MKEQVWDGSHTFWIITPCSPLKFNRRFGGTYLLHGRSINQARNQRESRWKTELLGSVELKRTTFRYVLEDRTFQVQSGWRIFQNNKY